MLAFLSFLLFSVVLAAYPSPLYTNHALVRTTLTSSQLDTLENELDRVDVWELKWSDSTKQFYEIDVLLCPAGREKLTEMGLSFVELMPQGEIQKQIDTEQTRLERRKIMTPGAYDPDTYFQDFRTLEEIYEFVDTYLLPRYSDLLSLYTIGQTIQGRTIRGFRITTDPSVQKPGIYLDAQVHAREWLATPTLLYIINSMLEDFERGDDEIVELLSAVEVHVTPIVNLDGFDYTWTTDRLWRKNRRLNPTGNYGVDLNRNWGPLTTWCTSGSSNNTGSNTYCGAAPFSEPEIEATRNYIDSSGIFRAGIDFHTTGPLILWPWQWTRAQVPEPNFSRLKNLGDQMQDAMNRVYNFGYRSIQGVDLYPHSGGFIDYNFEVNDMVTYTVEGRGPNFVIAPSQIVPSGIENYEGFKEMLRHVLEE